MTWALAPAPLLFPFVLLLVGSSSPSSVACGGDHAEDEGDYYCRLCGRHITSSDQKLAIDGEEVIGDGVILC